MTYSFDLERLQEAVRHFSSKRILVLGDVMLDEFIWGRVERISPEAPVPVVEVESETYMLGGAANVVHNLIALGCGAGICGLVGDDRAGKQVLELLDQLEVSRKGLTVSRERPTTVKTRVVAHSQQMVRVDRESRRECPAEELANMQAYLAEELPLCDAVIISDYAKGVISRAILNTVQEQARSGKLVVSVDPKVVNMPLYTGATVVTPNHHEALAAARISPQGDKAVERAGRQLLENLNAGAILITQGERGMTLITPEGMDHVPTMAKQVFDVTGAGDTVISTLTLGLVCGLTLSEAAVMANVAAGVVVGEVGTSAVTAGRLSKALEKDLHSLNNRNN
ncbi:MAG: D-glycero-beta-D-manno-heptose-7-phosphate kinase [Desulfarculaceae bacterium]|nr:D-glycero-beta-D-manno-heptose-7-phosphate kinase [Desulfarculaceae bacterium]MCF8048537.1 D-glycero-beta-D-manno-heptose-7-phosphate kinase [Desulfarculaceae bacterium]MCF8097326.1 D-glycero-beta-D-manno-heptose-7-phosphate kinase [Desulfarculaceae bacterium]MCF8121867.1 D-glycero-beta-D-manno-heptose-7-phosphate kinase [Desulfarculaceae bacterium]